MPLIRGRRISESSSLVYKVNSQTARAATQRSPVSPPPQKKIKKKEGRKKRKRKFLTNIS